MAKKPGEIKVGQKFQYVELPKGMDECYYELELKEVKELDSGNEAFVFEIMDTNTKQKVGSETSCILNPNQKLASIYYFKEMFAIHCALNGKEFTQKRVDKMTAKYKTIKKSFLASEEHVGKRAKLVIESYENKDGETKTRRTWEPLES